MKGLFIKDLHLMKMQIKFLLLIIAIAIIMLITSGNISFFMGYLTAVMPFFAISTIGYDEFDNSNAFLLTLPVSRKEYVVEKYLLGLFFGLSSYIFSILTLLGFGLFKDLTYILKELKASPTILSVILIIFAVIIPIKIKFGSEKGRIALVALGGITFIAGFGILKLLPLIGFDYMYYLDKISGINMGILIAAIALLVVLILLLSIKISINIMNKKEF